MLFRSEIHYITEVKRVVTSRLLKLCLLFCFRVDNWLDFRLQPTVGSQLFTFNVEQKYFRYIWFLIPDAVNFPNCLLICSHENFKWVFDDTCWLACVIEFSSEVSSPYNYCFSGKNAMTSLRCMLLIITKVKSFLFFYFSFLFSGVLNSQAVVCFFLFFYLWNSTALFNLKLTWRYLGLTDLWVIHIVA